MILDDKFVVVDKNNIEEIINILLKNGYSFTFDYKNDLKNYILNKKIQNFIIFSIEECLYWTEESHFFNIFNMKKKLNIKPLLRVCKLKRVLKCC